MFQLSCTKEQYEPAIVSTSTSLAYNQSYGKYGRSLPCEKELYGLVNRVIDGDTIVILVETNSYIVRLAEIDAPEKKQQFGMEAKEFTKKLSFQKVVNVKYKEKDKYGRIVGTVIIVTNGVNINQELLKNGLAYWYRQYSTNHSLGILEKEARDNKIGVWYSTNNVPPWKWRKQHKRN